MKVLFVALFLVAGAFAVPRSSIMAEGPQCPIDDPLIRPGPVPINITLPPVVELQVGSQITNLVIEGLTTLHYEINLNAIALTANFELTLDRVTGNGTFVATGYVDARPLSDAVLPSGNITGGGLGKVSAEGIVLKGSATLFINIIGNKVTISRLNLETVVFRSAVVDLSATLLVNGRPVDWATWSANIKANFDREFAANKDEVTDKIRLAANNIVGKYTLAELIDLITNPPGGGEC